MSAAAREQHDRYIRSAVRHWRIKTIQNLASAVVLTIAATVLVRLMIGHSAWKWPFVGFALAALASNAVIVTRNHPEAEAAHFQIARRYAALAASCRASVTRYEQALIEDSGFQALLDKHTADLADLKQDAEACLGIRNYLPLLHRG